MRKAKTKQFKFAIRVQVLFKISNNLMTKKKKIQTKKQKQKYKPLQFGLMLPGGSNVMKL